MYREILAILLASVASCVIFASSDLTPSRADMQMTQAVIDVAKPLGISVHDHIIVGKEGHASFKGSKLI